MIIAARFGDIFRSNCAKSGLLLVELDEERVHALWDVLEVTPGARVTVDLERGRVRAGEDFDEEFGVDDYTRWRLLNTSMRIGRCGIRRLKP